MRWERTAIHPLDLGIVLAYLAGMVAVGYLVAGRIRRFADFFVAGRALTTPILICTLVSSYYGLDALFGDSGDAAREGVEFGDVVAAAQKAGRVGHLAGGAAEVGGRDEVPIGLAAGGVVVGSVGVEPVSVLEAGAPEPALVEELGVTPMARLVGYAVAGIAPEIMGAAPINAIPKLLRSP